MPKNLWTPEKMSRWVTVYTDAGWKEGRAKVGFIARGSVSPTWLQGSGGTNCDSVEAAEAVAVLHALRKVGEAFQHPQGLEGFFVRSDNTNVVQALRCGFQGRALRPTVRGDFRKAVEGIFALCQEHGWSIQARHVKAHGREPDRIRRWMNDRADRLGNMRGVQV